MGDIGDTGDTGDTAGMVAAGWCELHCHTPFSLRGAGSSIEVLVARAAALGMPALAMTDTMTLGGVVRFHAACRSAGIRPITGCELLVQHPSEEIAGIVGDTGEVGTFIALARDRTGYAQLCGLLTRANLAMSSTAASTASTAQPVVPFADLAAHHDGLFLLAGGCDGLVQRLLLAGRTQQARAMLVHFAAAFGTDVLSLDLRHELLPESGLLQARSLQLATEVGIRCVATNGARYATCGDYRVYDLLTSVRLGLPLDQPHPERPRNAGRYLKAVGDLRPLFAAAPNALMTAGELAAACDIELLATHCVPPQVPLPKGETPATYLRTLCAAALPDRYPDLAAQAAAAHQLDHELAVIGGLALEEFFLVVHDIVGQAHERRIRCAGRGSAANSLVAYLLGITAVDPIAHHLLFERFLNRERQGMPDIDVDVQSSRREELIQYVEETYSERHAAMVANVVTYRLRLAVRDVGKALGFPLDLVDQLTHRLPHFGRCSEVARYADDLSDVMTRWRGQRPDEPDAPGAADAQTRHLERLALLLDLVPRLEGFPRHLSLHNGGLLLTREPLTECLPVRRSANGVRCVELDKDDVEALGFIKFDILGLRTFDAIEHCLDRIAETEGTRPPIDNLPLDPPDRATMDLVRAGQTLAVFQIESPAQWHLLSQTQPETFGDLVIQTALCRPGPIQAGMIHPYIARRQGSTPVTYLHPALEPILRDTLGITLYQEQVLEIAHTVAGLTYGEADGFRKAMSHYRTAAEMEGMRARFVGGAMRQGITQAVATHIFDEISCFVGYGFCRSHAAAFARTIYQTAYLKAHWPAHYLAGFISAQPAGFFPAATVVQEAKQLGIPVLPVDMQRSAAHFTVERLHEHDAACWPAQPHAQAQPTPTASSAIRIGLRQVKGVGEDLAQAIVAERRERGPYGSLAAFCTRLGQRVALRREAVEGLVAAGAFDALGIPRRRLLWMLAEYWSSWSAAWIVGQSGRKTAGTNTRYHEQRRQESQPAQLALPWTWPDERAADAPRLPHLTLEEEVNLDLATQGLSARPHPLTFRRRWLTSKGALPIARLAEIPHGQRALIVGLVISAQRPPTAHGVAFVVLEDEGARVQVVIPPPLAESLRLLLAESPLLAVSGRVERTGAARQPGQHITLLARALRSVPPQPTAEEIEAKRMKSGEGDHPTSARSA